MTFDKALTPGARNAGNWSAVFSSTLYNAVTANAAGSTVTCQCTSAGPTSPGNRCSYAPPPFDIIGTNGLPVALFTGYPIT